MPATDSHTTQFPPCLQGLAELLRHQRRPSAETVTDYLRKHASDFSCLQEEAVRNHPLEEGYGRKIFPIGSGFELMLVTWEAGDISAIHDHGEIDWGMVLCLDQLQGSQYRFQNRELSLLKAEDHRAGEVIQIDPHMIHQMYNPGPKAALSLHIYAFQGDLGHGFARIYDVEARNVKRAQGGAFFDLPAASILGLDGAIDSVDLGTESEQARLLAAFRTRSL